MAEVQSINNVEEHGDSLLLSQPRVSFLYSFQRRPFAFASLFSWVSSCLSQALAVMAHPERLWWKDAVVYQIYPASFKDSNNDGLGDIPGIISKIDYLEDLGIDVVWLSPMYESPQVDMGYDISNYEAVHSPYGTVEDMETLIKACHDRGIRLILDLVINHTSSEHSWFKESRSSKNSPKRDWYIWRPAKYDKDGNRMPPNNWRSAFGGSSWEWDDATEEYYLHIFAKEQPDLNWENQATREAIYSSAMRFWLDKGVDGFRVDMVNMYSKGTELRDAPIVDSASFTQPALELICNGPRMHEFLCEISEVLAVYNAMAVGELPNTPDPAHVLRYVGAAQKQLNMVFQFDLSDVGIGGSKYDYVGFELSEFKAIVTKWQKFIDGTDGWTTVFSESHDQGRSISRYASDTPQHRTSSGKMLAILMTTLTGTLFVYQGQELGMVNMQNNWTIEDCRDIEAINHYDCIKKSTSSNEKALEKVMQGIHLCGRDNARTPMQWEDTANAGFSTARPWMRVNDLYPEINVAQQQGDTNSVLSFWKKMLRLRKEFCDLFVYGTFEDIDGGTAEIFVYGKQFNGKKAVVALNFTGALQRFVRPAVEGNWELLVSSSRVLEEGSLHPYEGRAYLVS